MNRHYHDFSKFVILGVPVTRWQCSCGIKTWRRKNVKLLEDQSRAELELKDPS